MKKIFGVSLLIIMLIWPSRNLFSDSIAEQMERELKNTEQALITVLKDHAHWHRLSAKNYQSTTVAVGIGLSVAIAAFTFLVKYPGCADPALSIGETGGLITLIAGVPAIVVGFHLDYTSAPSACSAFPKEMFQVSARIEPDGKLVLTTFARGGYPLKTLQFDHGVKSLIEQTVRNESIESLPFLDFMITHVDEGIIQTPLKFTEEELSLPEWFERFWDADKPGLLETLFRPSATQYFMRMAYLYDLKKFILQEKKRLLIREIACRK